MTTFGQLRDLVLLEEFKNCLPEKIATYVNEQKALTVATAAVLADEYVLTHQEFVYNAVSRDQGRGEGFVRPNVMQHHGFKPDSSRDGFKVCNFCHKRGHVKADCYLKARPSTHDATPKGVGLAAPLPKDIKHKGKNVRLEAPDSYLPFIREGYVSGTPSA